MYPSLASCRDENSLEDFINVNEELISSDKQTSQTSRAVTCINLILARCHIIHLQFGKLPTSDLQDEIIRFGQRWMQLLPNLANLNEIFKYPCQELYRSKIRAQFHYILGTCVLQMAQEKTVSEGDAISMATALFGLSLREGSKRKKNLLNMNWKDEDATVVSKLSCVRVSHTWHFLNKILDLQGRDFFVHHQEKWCNESGYHQMLNQVLGLDQSDDANEWVTSLMSQLSLHHLTIRGIESRRNEIVEIDSECIINDQHNLPLLVWTCMQWDCHDIETTPVFKAFIQKRGLPFSASNLSHCSVLSLCILDIVIFLHAVAICMEEELEKLQHHLELRSVPLMSYPYRILNLGNQRQIDWFNALHQHLEVKDSSKDFIPVVEAGLEVLRCRSHKERMGTELLIYLGRMMKESMLKYNGLQTDKKRCQAYEERCLLYWQEALNQLEKLKNGEDILESRNPLFPHSGKKFTIPEVEELIEEAAESLAECQPEGRQTRAKTPAQLPYTPPTPEDGMSGLPTPYQTDSDRRDRSSFPTDGTYQEPSYSGRFATPSQRSSDTPMSSNPGHSRKQQSPFSPHEYLQEPRHSTPAERTHVSTPTRQSYDRTTLQQGEPFHSTPAGRTHISTPPRHERHQKPQNELTPVSDYHHSLRQDPRGTPDWSDRSLETSYLPYMTPENRSEIYRSSVADNTNYEIEVIGPSPQRLTSEVRDLNRSQHQHEAKNDELKKTQREIHAKSLNQNKQLSNNIKNLTERVLALEAEQREADNIRMNEMSARISGLEERSTDTENKFQELEIVLEDQNQKNLECVQGLLAQVEDLKTRNREHEIRYELLKQNQAKLQEALIKTSNELLRRQIVAQKEQEKYNRELQESLNELILQNQREWEKFRSDLTQMEQSVNQLDEFSTEMRTRIEGLEDKNEQNDETLRYYQENLEQSVQELKNNLAKQKDEVDNSLNNLEEKIEAVRMEKVEQAAPAGPPVGPPQAPQQRPQGAVIDPTPYQQQTRHPHAVTYVPLVPMQGTYLLGMHEGGTPTEEATMQEQQIIRGGPYMQPGGDTGGYTTGLEPVPSSQVSQTANLPQPVTPMRGMRAPPLQYPSPTSVQFISVPQQPGFSPQNIRQRMEAAPSLTAYPAVAAQRQQPSVMGNQPGIHLPTVPSTIGPALSTATPATQGYPMRPSILASQSPTRQQVPPPRAAQSPVAGSSSKATPSGGISYPTSQVPGQSVSTSSTPKPGEDTTVPKGLTPAKPSVSQQDPDLLNLPVRRPGENFISATPQIHEGGDLTPGLHAQMQSSFGDPATSKLNFAGIAAAGDAGSIRGGPSKPYSQFPGAGTQLFESSSTPQQEEESITEDQEYDPHYIPVMSLPENVDLTTGDEGQEVVFRERAKLYRYDSDTQAWKERGVGDMKILKDPETGKARILMRREQVLKVCANHWLNPDMQLLLSSSSDRAFVWNAIDFAEGEECHEKFAVKFNTPELAAEFKKTFDQMKEGAGPSSTKPIEPVEEEPAETPQDTQALSTEEVLDQRSQQADPLEAWGELRSQEEEEAETKAEKMEEKEDVVPKDEDGGYEEDQQQLSSGEAEEEGTEDSRISKQQPFFGPSSFTLSSSLPQFGFSSTPNTSVSAFPRWRGMAPLGAFGSPPRPQQPSAGFSFGVSPPGISSPHGSSPQDQPVPPASTSTVPHWRGMAPLSAFGSPPRQQQPSAGFSFGISPPGISSFHGPSSQDQPVPPASNLQTPERPLHDSGPSAATSISGEKFPAKFQELSKSGEHYQEEQRDDTNFEPVVTLPENYKLETGEENEEVKFSQRAILYHFDVEGSQWKERGEGDIKVLYNPETKQHRIIMRREQDMTVCANHNITHHIDLQPDEGFERSWVWQAMDSSDGDPQNEQLAVTFETNDAAREFKEVVDEAKANLQGTSDQPVEPVGKAETKKELVPAESYKQEDGDADSEGEDKKEVTKKGSEDRRPAVESKEAEEPVRPTQDVTVEEKGEVEGTEEKREVEEEQKLREEKQETPAPASLSTKDEDVATKEQEVKPPPGEEKEPEDRRPAVESKEAEEPARPTQHVTVEEKGEVEAKKEVEGEKEISKEKKETPAPASLSTKDEDLATKEQEVKPPPGEAEDKAKPVEVTGKVESKEKAKVPSKPSEDVKTKKKDEVKEAGKDEDSLREKKGVPEEKKEPSRVSPEKTKEEDVKEKDTASPSTKAEDKAKPVEVPGKVESKEKAKVPSKPSEDVKTKKKDEVKEAGKDEDSLREKKGVPEEKKEPSRVSPEKTKEEDVKEKDTVSPSTKAEDKIKHEEIPGKVDSQKVEDEPSKPKEDVTPKEKDEVKETGKDEETSEEKTKEEKKETSPVLPKKTKVEDDKQKETVPPSAKDEHKGDEKHSKPADEEVPAEKEEKEPESNREIRFSAPADLSYADENKDWKLRGKGQFQILFDKDDKNFLVEMKRDEDNSLCAKHPITKAIQLMPVRGQDRSYAWSAVDSSDKEGSPVPMTFAVRFKNRETADNFQEEFQKAQGPTAVPLPAGKGKDKKEKEKKKKEPKKDKDKKGDHPSDPSLHSSQVSLTPSQASSQPQDAPQSPKSPKSPKDGEKKKPEKKKKKDPSLHSSQVSLTPSQASSQPQDAPQSPKSPKSPKDGEEKKPEKKKKKGFFKRVKDKVTGMLEGSDESDGGGDGGSSSSSSSSESSSDEDREKK